MGFVKGQPLEGRERAILYLRQNGAAHSDISNLTRPQRRRYLKKCNRAAKRAAAVQP